MGTAQVGPSHLLKAEEEEDVLRRGMTGPDVGLSFAPPSLHEVPRLFLRGKTSAEVSAERELIYGKAEGARRQPDLAIPPS